MLKLMTILYIGEAVAWIDENGGFTCLDKDKMVEAIKEHAAALRYMVDLHKKVNDARN